VVCPECGSAIAPGSIESNPYAPPSTPLDEEPELPEVSPVEPTSLAEKLLEAFRLLFSNLGLLAAIILTVWLPGNIVINYAAYNMQEPDNPFATMRFNNFIEGAFGPIYVGGMIYALAQRKQGKWVTYSEAISVGFRNWGRLFGTRFVTGFIVLAGLILFIIPGIILLLKYALIDNVVVLEETSGGEARERSAALTTGKRWQIVGAYVVYSLMVIPAGFGIGWVVEQFPAINNMWTAIATDSVLDIVASYIVIVLFLFYWEAAHAQT
jgi:hypothetical protein